MSGRCAPLTGREGRVVPGTGAQLLGAAIALIHLEQARGTQLASDAHRHDPTHVATFALNEAEALGTEREESDF
jgi:hypothetical protein